MGIIREILKENSSLIIGTLICLLVSSLYFIILDFAIKAEILTKTTSTSGYILVSLVLGFSTIWLIYNSYDYLKELNKKKKIW